jgi:5-methylcytosine-specific restriction enzyme A
VSVLYYWRPDNYVRDRRFGFGYHLNQNSPVLASIVTGDSVWAFTRDRLGRYVLAAELVVKAITRNPPGYRYGRYRVWGDAQRTRYFDIDATPDAEPLIRHLKLTTNAAILAQSFQGRRAVKALDKADQQLISSFARGLPTLERVHLYPEDEFEARLVMGSGARELLLRESKAAYGVRMRYLFETIDITRARRHVEWLQTEYSGRCQICLYDPRSRYGRNLSHGHHIQWLSRGGDDTLENLMLICPNHHGAVHQDDAVFDFQTLAFYFSNGLVEEIRLNNHLERAA